MICVIMVAECTSRAGYQKGDNAKRQQFDSCLNSNNCLLSDDTVSTFLQSARDWYQQGLVH